MMNRKLRFVSVILALFFIAGMASCGTMNIGNTPWDVSIKDWQPKQKADFMMSMWLAEKQSYDMMNAIENKSEDLVRTLNVKYEILEKSRVPMRMYATVVNAGGTPTLESEQELIDWLRQLQINLVYGGGN